MKKARLFLSALFFASLCGGLALSEGKKESNAAPEDQKIIESQVSAETGAPGWKITAPEKAFSGDCVVVLFSSATGLTGCAVRLIGPTGKPIAEARAFSASAAPESAASVALIGLSTQLESGAYTLEATALYGEETVRSVLPLAIEKANFFSETIPLDSKNTAIKTDMSPERLHQIDILNAILLRQDIDSPRYPGPFRAPLHSTRRTSHFGDRRVYIYSNKTTVTNVHYGIDFGVPKGTPVFSSGDGLVVFAGKRISTGLTVVIEHLPGVYSLYYHLDALLTAKGEPVRAGTLIGRSGSTGLSTGPHLHWEFRVNGEAVSPDWFVSRTLY